MRGNGGSLRGFSATRRERRGKSVQWTDLRRKRARKPARPRTEFDLVQVVGTVAFQNALWLFLGVVAGALIQHFLHRLNLRWQRNTAFAVLKSEIDLNLDALAGLEDRVRYLKERISAGQIDPDELFISMGQFD